MNRQKIIYNIIYSSIAILTGIIIAFSDPEKVLKLVSILLGLAVILNVLPVFISLLKDRSINDRLAFINAIIYLFIGSFLVFCPDTIKGIAYIVSGVILLVIPIVKIIKNRKHFLEFKEQLVKLIIGSVLVFGGVGSLVQIVLYVLGGSIAIVGIYYLIYNLLALYKLEKKEKKDKKENDVIDV